MSKNVDNWPALNVEKRNINDLLPYANNARVHSDEQVAQIAASIREWGFTNPVLIDPDGEIIAGHGRVMALRRLSIDTVPVIVAHGWSEAQKKAYVIADNKLAENASWNEELLKVELSALTDLGFDLELTGFDEDDLHDLFDGAPPSDKDPDAAPPVQKSTCIKPGDVWILGPHRVICGDSTEKQSYERLLVGDLVDCVWTDPPYNVNYSSAAGAIKNDNMDSGDFLAFLSKFFESAIGAVKPGGSIYVAHADTEGKNFRTAFESAGFKLSGCLIWQKDSLVLGRSDYQWQHEPILYGWRPGGRHRWFGGRRQTTFMKNRDGIFTLREDGSLQIKVGDAHMVVKGDNLVAEAIEPTVLRCEKPRSSGEHPTMKPVDLICRMLRNSSRKGDIVLNPFGGSGSTLIASEMLGRCARLIELDDIYCDVIIRRWQEFTSDSAVRESDGAKYDDLAPSEPASGGTSENEEKPKPDSRKTATKKTTTKPKRKATKIARPAKSEAEKGAE